MVAVVAMVGIRIAVVSTVGITVRSITVVMAVVSISLWLSISGPLAVVVSVSVGVSIGAVVAMVSQSIPVSVVGKSVPIMSIVSISLWLSISGPLAVVVAMVGIGVAVVAMVSVPVSEENTMQCQRHNSVQILGDIQHNVDLGKEDATKKPQQEKNYY